MIEIERTTLTDERGVRFECLIAAPETPPGGAHGVLLLHDITGGEDDIRRNLSIVAEQGYLAMAPLLFTAGPRRIGCIVSTMRTLALRRGSAFGVIEAARVALVEDPRCTGKAAVVGFCMGGGFALLIADERYVASAPFYGVTGGMGFIDEHTCPVVASLGGTDPFNPAAERRLRRALDRAGVESDVRTYPGTWHGFANRLDIPGARLLQVMGMGHHAEATTDAWRRVFAFFDDTFASA